MSSTTFSYTGAQQTYTVPTTGFYKIEVWGAEGGGSRLSGNTSSGVGGLGGYVYGTVRLVKGTPLYIHVGGRGKSSTSGTASGGYNGGGAGYASETSEPGNGGGGATDVRLVSSAWNNSAGLYSRIIVAGGGGGGGEDPSDAYGHGGGTSGTNGTSTAASNGTQTSAGTNGGFGYGGSTNYGDGGGGGGGWYGGGTNSSATTGTDTAGGGGGSGYVLTSTSTKPSGYTPTLDYCFTETALQSGVQQGDGKCVITFLYADEDKEVSKIYTFSYTGSMQQFVVPTTGLYQLEVWGAQGGSRSTAASGGLGGYSTGEINLKKGEILNIYVGGDGSSSGKGWNGGGQAGYSGIYGGGGTDIRYNGTALTNRIIVAGGGGSVGAANKAGGYGGGTTGQSRTDSFGSGGQGGSQTAGGSGSSSNTGTQGSLGQGGKGYYVSSGYGGGGGGGYYGGAGSYPDDSGDDDRGGGGGSGYVNTNLLTNTKLIAGNAAMPNISSSTSGTIIGKTGHGYCRIVLFKKSIPPVFVNINGTWKEAIPYINVNGVWKEANPQVNVNGTWKNL